MTQPDTRPHLTDARRKANETYQRRRARTAADTLLEIAPALWDDATRRIILVTLPSLLFAIQLAEYGEPRPLQAAWCDYGSDAGYCTLPEGHAGDHDVDPDAGPPSVPPLECARAEHHPGECNPHADYYQQQRAERLCRRPLRVHDNGDYRA